MKENIVRNICFSKQILGYKSKDTSDSQSCCKLCISGQLQSLQAHRPPHEDKSPSREAPSLARSEAGKAVISAPTQEALYTPAQPRVRDPKSIRQPQPRFCVFPTVISYSSGQLHYFQDQLMYREHK